MTLRSPRDGYVNVLPNTNTNWAFPGMVLPILQVGDTVRAGMGVVQIPDMQTWETTARIEEADRGHLALHQPVTITAVALPEHPYHGHHFRLGRHHRAALGPTFRMQDQSAKSVAGTASGHDRQSGHHGRNA